MTPGCRYRANRGFQAVSVWPNGVQRAKMVHLRFYYGETSLKATDSKTIAIDPDLAAMFGRQA
jgi:hypothetical protein